MNYYLLLSSFVIFLTSYLFQLSYSNGFSYEVHIRTSYSTEGITTITCVSYEKTLEGMLILRKDISGEDKSVHWLIKAGRYDHDTDQRCTVRDHTRERFFFTAFRGSWKLDEIIWQTSTFDDFIFDPLRENRIYHWYANEKGAYLYKFKTSKSELVVPMFSNEILAEVFVSNLFDNGRKIAVLCMHDKEEAEGASKIADEKALPHKNSVSWIIRRGQYFAGEVQTCVVGWTDETAGKTKHSFLTAFNDSWELHEKLHESYTFHDFSFNPYSRTHNYLWGISENGISLYNFREKEYQVVNQLV